MEQHDYAAELPQEPPEGLIPWLQKKGKLQEHVIWYKAAWVHDPLTGQRKRMAQLRCSACGDTMYAGRIPNPGHTFGYVDPESGHPVSSGNHVRCPMCGCAAEALHVGRGRGGRYGKEYWPLTITRVGDRLALVGWCVGKYISCEGVERISCRQYEAYVVEERKVVRLMGYIKCLSTVSFFGHWEQRRNCLDNWGEADLVYPWDRRLLIGSTAENSKLDLYMRAAKEPYPVTYLRLWQRHRNIENLIMQGCGALVGEMIRAESYRYSYERARGVPQLAEINWKEKRPAKMLGLSGEEFRFCRALKWTPEELQFYRLCRETGIRLRVPEDLDDCKAAGLYWCRWVIEQERAPLLRTVRYLKRQRTKDRRADRPILDDYWRIARGEGYDLADEHVRFPKDLLRAHDRVAEERRVREEARQARDRAEKNEKLREAFAARLEALAPLAWQQGGILIRPCAAPEELDAEGRALSHCVATYKDKHASGKTAIFFVRKASEPDKPWFTLELKLDDFTVVQNRGKCNCARTKAVEAFEAAWLEHIRPMKKKKGNDAA
ncbi:PcfJ domain-containing protein [Dysosmobacter sp.]|uniref:PcfJ domain-containing protein n=1 Tax=Dysosmobacter sp. TaxID=2591382 RepID=UPI003AB56ABF